MSFETLLFDVEDHVGRLTLNRPDAGNSMNAVMMRELRDVAICCDEDPEIRAVLITGAGKMFCAGGDLHSFAKEGDGLPAYLKGITNDLHDPLIAGCANQQHMKAHIGCQELPHQGTSE